MFLKTHRIRKDGKEHVYYSLCESVRVRRSRVTRRTVLHLGELNTTQVDRWERTIETVQENGQRQQLRLFTDRQGQLRSSTRSRLSNNQKPPADREKRKVESSFRIRLQDVCMNWTENRSEMNTIEM